MAVVAVHSSMSTTYVYIMVVVAVQAQQYAALRKPYLINDIVMQDMLLDRRKVYKKLEVSHPAM